MLLLTVECLHRKEWYVHAVREAPVQQVMCTGLSIVQHLGI